MCDNDIRNDQNAIECDDERVALANLIANLKLDVDENKKSQKQLKKANTSLTQELTECKSILTETSRTLGESNRIRDSCLVALQTKQTEFEKYKACNDRAVDYDKLERKLNETLGLLAQKDIDIKEGLKLKAYEISVVKEKHDELVKHSLLTKSHYEDLLRALTAHDMEILIQSCLMPLAIKTQSDSLKFVHELKQEMHADLKYVESLEKEIDELESEKAEFSDMYDVILQECVSKDVMCSYLMSLSDLDALAELQYKNIAISELKKLIEMGKGKYVDTKFDRSSVVRQPNAQRIPKPSILGKPTPFSDSLERKYFPKTKSVPKTNVSEGLSKPVTAQTLPQAVKKAVSNTNVLKLGMYRIDNRIAHTRAPQLPQTVRNTNPYVFASTGVNHKPTVSKPQLKSNQSRDKMKSVTACKDSLNSRTFNANVVCATCNKCLVDSNHFACVTKMLNDVYARTKKPTVVHISTRKPKSQANKSFATPHKKKVASKPTNQKPQSYFRVMYENTNKAWKWWIERQSTSGYKWVPKPKKQWVPKKKFNGYLKLRMTKCRNELVLL
nr:hypothetical protein [Tanacetum cinerariifolium]